MNIFIHIAYDLLRASETNKVPISNPIAIGRPNENHNLQ